MCKVKKIGHDVGTEDKPPPLRTPKRSSKKKKGTRTRDLLLGPLLQRRPRYRHLTRLRRRIHTRSELNEVRLSRSRFTIIHYHIRIGASGHPRPHRQPSSCTHTHGRRKRLRPYRTTAKYPPHPSGSTPDTSNPRSSSRASVDPPTIPSLESVVLGRLRRRRVGGRLRRGKRTGRTWRGRSFDRVGFFCFFFYGMKRFEEVQGGKGYRPAAGMKAKWTVNETNSMMKGSSRRRALIRIKCFSNKPGEYTARQVTCIENQL